MVQFLQEIFSVVIGMFDGVQDINPMLLTKIEVILSYIPANSLILVVGSQERVIHPDEEGGTRDPDDFCSGSLAGTVNQFSVLYWEDHWKSDIFQSHLQQIFDDTS